MQVFYLEWRSLNIILSYKSKMYDPLKYPPDLDLAQMHSQCTQPGDHNPQGRVCPCCQEQEKKPIKNWWRRNIRKDFTKYGGAVVTYFSLLKYYAAATLVIFILYGGFQTVVTRQACDTQRASNPGRDLICVDPMGLWVISTADLTDLMRAQGDQDKVTILLYLRGAAFVILAAINFGSLYLVSSRRFHTMIKEQPGLQHFALFFKNIDKAWGEQDLKQEILKVSPDIAIKEVVILKKADQYKKFYDEKVTSYFKLQSQKLKPKKEKENWNKLKRAFRKLQQRKDDLSTPTGRAIVTFNSIADVKLVKKQFKLKCTEELFVKSDFCGASRMYVDSMPKPDQIFWNYIGKETHQKFQMKVITFFIMVGLLGVSYAILDGGLNLADVDDKSNIPATRKIISTLMALAVVALALCFRAAMNVLSEMRHPNTQTSKTMFIVCTTVIYHFLYFLIIPTIFFFNAQQNQKSLKLFSISYQAINFMLVQLILAGCDVFYCCWASSRKKLLNNPDSGLCQAQLHKAVTAPRFPMQFKLIILFKTWSFVIFYAFQAPLILFFIFVTLIFLLINDRKNLYTHYRMQTIDYHVQRRFLSIYTNFFVIYMCFIFLLAQKVTVETPLTIVVTAIGVISQIVFAVRDKESKHIDENVTFDEIVGTTGTYGERYQKFLNQLSNPELDAKIEQFVERIGKKESLIGTEGSLNQRLLDE